MNLRAKKCDMCGAPLTSLKCDYCGTEYEDVKNYIFKKQLESNQQASINDLRRIMLENMDKACCCNLKDRERFLLSQTNSALNLNIFTLNEGRMII